MPKSKHTCHARECKRPCKPQMLMCRAHWYMVPKDLQREIWRHYREGQCEDCDVSPGWMLAARKAICAVAVKEGLMTQDQADAVITKLARLLGKEPTNATR